MAEKMRFVCHPKRPEWGAGRVVEQRPEYLTVYFEAVGPRKFRVPAPTFEEIPDESVGAESLLRHLVQDDQGAYVVPALTFNDVVGNFLRLADGGFTSEKYIATERAYKEAAVVRASQCLGEAELSRLNAAGDFTAVVKAYLYSVKATNLVVHQETNKVAALGVEAHRAFALAVADLLHGPGPFDARFDAAADVFADLGVATWPLCTYPLFVTSPKQYLLVKPEGVKRAASALGYEIGYRTTPNARTYANIRGLARYVSEKLEQRGLPPRDMIDVQSFLWLGTGGYDEASARAGGREVGARFNRKTKT
jgi:hypothetical protein